MEDTNVGQGVEVEPDVIRARLSQLEQMLERLDAVTSSVEDMRRRHGPSMWSTVGVCQEFTQSMGDALDRLRGWLSYDRAEIGRLRDTLHETWRTHEINDQEVEARLVALANKINEAPPTPTVCTPYDEPVPVPSPTPAPSDGGGSW